MRSILNSASEIGAPRPNEISRLGLGTEGVKGLKARLSALDCITPGDFAAIERGSAFSPIQNAAEFLRRLEDDAALKNEGRKKPRIGF